MIRIVCTLLTLTFSKVALAYDVSGIKVGDKFESVKDMMPYEVKSEPNFQGKEYGFMEHLSHKAGHSIRVSTRPDDTIYSISFYQEFPVKQAESIKSQLCEKYNFGADKCWWSAKYEDIPPNMGGTLFSQGQRQKDQNLSVNIEKAWDGRKLKDGYIALKITIAVKRPTKEVDLWAKKVQDLKNRAQVEKAIESSSNDDSSKPMF